MDEIKIGAEQEIYLAPETEKFENADEIAKISLDVEKYPFIIRYDANQKDNIITKLEKLGCDEIKQLDFADCIAVSMSMAQLKAIKTLNGVERVEKDYDYKCLIDGVSESEYSSYLAGINPQLNKKKEVKLAIFDTGVTNISVNDSVNFVNDSTRDEGGHGTQMTGIISSVVTNSENKVASPSIYSVVVADHRGFAKTSTIMQALDWAINNGIKIVCMSFGDYHKSELLENMINRASSCGIVMVAAAGNDGGFEDENRIMYPAAFDNVLSVGAKNGDTIANYSNGGEKADCFANGLQSTTDINGNAVNVIGTSGATAFVAGTILKNWCVNPEKTSLDIIADIKTEMSLTAGVEKAETLTLTKKNDILINEKENIASNVTELNARSLDEGVSVLCVGDDGCSSNDMSSAINAPLVNWVDGCIGCPGGEVWYKFTTIASEAHPNGSKGWYGIQTQGSLDTMGYLYDAYGNQIDYDDSSGNNMNFKITHQLDYGETYYVKVKAYGNNTGSFYFKVDFGRDDHGNKPETATEIVGVYYQDKSVSGYLHSYGDVDYYTFVPARNCVMEIYTEGDTNTYGQLYCASGGLLDSDNNSNGNGNFKITAHLEGMKRYYIAVSHNSSTGYGDYTLRFKFVRDYMEKPNLGSSTSPNYTNLRTYINWIPEYNGSSMTYITDYVGVSPVFETKTIIGRTWMNWSTAEHWNLHVVDSTEENSNSIRSTLVDYAAESIATSALTKVFCSVFKLVGLKAAVAGVVLGGIVSLFSSAIDTNSSNSETQKFQEYARDITNDNSKWIMSEGINYKHNDNGLLYDPMHLQGTNDTTYEMDYNNYFYGYQGMRGTFVSEFAKSQ